MPSCICTLCCIMRQDCMSSGGSLWVCTGGQAAAACMRQSTAVVTPATLTLAGPCRAGCADQPERLWRAAAGGNLGICGKPHLRRHPQRRRSSSYTQQHQLCAGGRLQQQQQQLAARTAQGGWRCWWWCGSSDVHTTRLRVQYITTGSPAAAGYSSSGGSGS